MRSKPLSRRSYLTAVGGAGAAIGLGSIADPVASSTQSTGAIEGFTVRRDTLYVDLADVGAADRVALIDPNGQQHGEAEIGLGETSAGFTILPRRGDPYQDGTYTAYAYRETGGGTEEVGSAEIEFEPEVRVVGFESRFDANPLLVLENPSNAPVLVRRVRIVEGTPNYTDESGDGGAATEVYVDPGTRVAVQYDRGAYVSPMRIGSEDAATDLAGSTATAAFEVVTERGDTFTDSFEVAFSDATYHHDGIGNDHYSCEYVSGGEVTPYE